MFIIQHTISNYQWFFRGFFMIKKLFIFLLFTNLFCPRQLFAQMPYLEEAKSLGIIAGQGLACNASRYPTFEMLARAIILTKSPSDALQNQALHTYTSEKANIFVLKQLDNFNDCPNIAMRFDSQQIFQSTLYGDGTIKMPDGQIITPRKPYDAKSIYDFNSQDLARANSIYNKDYNHLKKVNFIDKSVNQ